MPVVGASAASRPEPRSLAWALLSYKGIPYLDRTMRALLALGVTFAAAVALTPAAADVTMYKCTRDGTTLYQARPCGSAEKASTANGSESAAETTNGAERTQRKLAQGDPRVTGLVPTANVQERAVLDREEAQRRDRCRNSREIADKQRALLASDAQIDRKAVSDELAIQERRMKQDRC